MFGTRFFKLSVVFLSLVAFTSSQAGFIPVTNKAILSIRGKKKKIIIDPFNVRAIQVDVQFDPGQVKFRSIIPIAPFEIDAQSPPNLERLSEGFLEDVFVVVPDTVDPPEGHVDIFEVFFEDVGRSKFAQFTVFASSNDFMRGFDPDTGETVNVDPLNIVPATFTTPEPSSFALIAIGMLGLVGNRWRVRQRAACLQIGLPSTSG